MSNNNALIDARAGDDLSPLAGTWSVDPTHSSIGFVARYAVFTRVRGRFTSLDGTVVINPCELGRTRVDVRIDAASVDTSSAPRDAHLRGPDFFDVERHPTISFRSETATVLAAGRYTVRGELSIRGVTQPVRLEAHAFGCAPDVIGNPRLAFRASATVQRELWGMTWNQPVRGGGTLLAQEVELVLDVSLIKKSSEPFETLTATAGAVAPWHDPRRTTDDPNRRSAIVTAMTSSHQHGRS